MPICQPSHWSVNDIQRLLMEIYDRPLKASGYRLCIKRKPRKMVIPAQLMPANTPETADFHINTHRYYISLFVVTEVSITVNMDSDGDF